MPTKSVVKSQVTEVKLTTELNSVPGAPLLGAPSCCSSSVPRDAPCAPERLRSPDFPSWRVFNSPVSDLNSRFGI